MEMISWESGGKRHWSAMGADWLAVRWSRSNDNSILTLHEGSHHYFTEFYQYDDSDTEIERATLLGPGPFSIHIDSAKAGLVMLKVHFIQYASPPLEPGEKSHLVSCGFLEHLNLKQDIHMEIYDRISPSGEPLVFEEQPSEGESPIRSYPELSGDRSDPDEEVVLQRALESDTTVWFVQTKFLKDEEAEAELKLGTVLPLHSLKEKLDSAKIPRGSRTPMTSLPYSDWNLAVPVMDTDPGKGMLGMPMLHANAEPIKNFSLRFKGTEIRASWEWTLPLPWMDVVLWWYISRSADGLEAEEIETLLNERVYLSPELTAEWIQYYQENQRVDVDWSYYTQVSKLSDNPGSAPGSVRVTLPIDRRSLRRILKDCSLSVIACPRLFGEALADHQKDAFVDL